MRPDYFPLIVLVLVFLLVAVRQVGGFKLGIWQIMLGGAFLVLASGSITPLEALGAINLDVIIFLFGMFVVGEALVESGYLYHLSFVLFKRARTANSLVLAVLFVMGFFSSFLMNDTVAIIGTPLVLYFSGRHGVSAKLMLLALCFAVTIGSVPSPIGNPQNLLIAIGSGMANPFVTFLRYLFVPTVVNLFAAYLVLKLLYRGEFHSRPLESVREEIRDTGLARLSKVSLWLIFLLVALKVATVFTGWMELRLTYIAVIAALPVILFSPKRMRVLRRIDWHTLVFFASLFVLMESVWRSGFLQYLINGWGGDLSGVEPVLLMSAVLSQLLSNVPFVALYLPVLTHLGAGVNAMAALAAGSTIAGNLLILGAASNIIVIQNAEKRGHTLSFYEFARAGVPLTLINIFVYWVFLRWV
ncbi:MAG TPA: anion transporter [Thermodesulfobacteriota bacterium]|nr:anion transporter [Thermodesulfobacteriota bacterium]